MNFGPEIAHKAFAAVTAFYSTLVEEYEKRCKLVEAAYQAAKASVDAEKKKVAELEEELKAARRELGAEKVEAEDMVRRISTLEVAAKANEALLSAVESKSDQDVLKVLDYFRPALMTRRQQLVRLLREACPEARSADVADLYWKENDLG